MKKTIVFMTALLVMAVLFASCSNGMGEKADGEGGSAATKAVKVSLSLGGDVANIAQKEVAVTSDSANPNTYTYFYRATPNWTGNTVGKTTSQDDNFVEIVYPAGYEDAFTLGFFTPGKWTFDVEVRASDKTKVLYVGQNDDVSITTAGFEVVVPMSVNNGQSATGTVKIAVAVPYISDYTKVRMALDGTPLTQVTKGDDKKAHADSTTTYVIDNNQAGWELFTKDITPATGPHTLTLQYVDYPTEEDYNNEENGKVVGGAAVALTLLKDETYLVCGTIENGKYQIVTLTLGMPVVDLEWTTEPAASVAQEETCNCAVTTGYSTYQWYVNGDPVQDATSYQFALPTAWPGVYEVTCKAVKNVPGGGSAQDSVSKTVTVEPAKIINIVSKVNNTGASINKAYTGNSITCTPVGAGINNAVRFEWYVSKDGGALAKQSAVIANNVFTFATTPTPSTTPTSAEGSYKIVCKTYSAAEGGDLIGYGEKTITLTTQQ